MLKYRLLRNCTFGEYFMSPGSMEQGIGYIESLQKFTST